MTPKMASRVLVAGELVRVKAASSPLLTPKPEPKPKVRGRGQITCTKLEDPGECDKTLKNRRVD